MLIKVDVASFGFDAEQNIPVILLKESGGERTIPIAIGPHEAGAIAAVSMSVGSERPLTIDLARMICEELGGSLLRVVVYDLIAQVFYAHLYISSTAGMHIIDCRPSDALAMALRMKADVFVKETVFEKVLGVHPSDERENIRKNIASLDTLNFGTYYIQ